MITLLTSITLINILLLGVVSRQAQRDKSTELDRQLEIGFVCKDARDGAYSRKAIAHTYK